MTDQPDLNPNSLLQHFLYGARSASRRLAWFIGGLLSAAALLFVAHVTTGITGDFSWIAAGITVFLLPSIVVIPENGPWAALGILLLEVLITLFVFGGTFVVGSEAGVAAGAVLAVGLTASVVLAGATVCSALMAAATLGLSTALRHAWHTLPHGLPSDRHQS